MSIYAKFYHGFDHDNMRHYQVSFRCGVTIDCKPPYVAGKMDSCWTSIRKDGKLPNPTDQEGCENLLGMRLMPI